MVKFKDNDIYALEVKDKKSKYHGRYIILIKYSNPEWSNNVNKGLFRFKITRKKALPKLEEINDLEYVITWFEQELGKYFPWESIPFEQLKAKRDKKKVYPDKYGYLYIYITEIYWYNKNVPQDLIYIGNTEIEPPEKEYIPFNEYGGVRDYKTWDNIVEKILKSYEDYNLGKSEWFNEEGAKELKRQWELQIKGLIKLDKFVDYLEENNLLEDFVGDEERIEESLTYVGGEDEDPYSGD